MIGLCFSAIFIRQFQLFILSITPIMQYKEQQDRIELNWIAFIHF